MTDPEQDAADRLDAEIDALLGGHAPPDAEPGRLWLATALGTPAPATTRNGVAARVRALVERRWRWARFATALLGALFLAQGVGSIVAGRWVAAGLGEPFGAHVTLEGGLATMAVGFTALLCASRRGWLPVALVTVVPLGLVQGAHGPSELQTFAWGAALHLSQGVAALLVLGAVAHARYGRGGRREPSA